MNIKNITNKVGIIKQEMIDISLIFYESVLVFSAVIYSLLPAQCQHGQHTQQADETQIQVS